MSSLEQIRDSLSSTIGAAVTDLTGYPTVPEVTNLPAFVVIPRDTDYETSFGQGFVQHMLDVIVLVSRRDDELAQNDLDKYVNPFGSSSIRQAVFQTRDLGLPDVEAAVTRMSDYGAQFDVGDLDHVGARLNVRVLTSGTA